MQMIGVKLIFASAMKNSLFNSPKSGAISMNQKCFLMALTTRQAAPWVAETAVDSVRTASIVVPTKNSAAANIRCDFHTKPKADAGVVAENRFLYRTDRKTAVKERLRLTLFLLPVELVERQVLFNTVRNSRIFSTI